MLQDSSCRRSVPIILSLSIISLVREFHLTEAGACRSCVKEIPATWTTPDATPRWQLAFPLRYRGGREGEKVRIHSRAHGVTAGLPLVMKPIVRRTYARSLVFSRAQHPATRCTSVRRRVMPHTEVGGREKEQRESPRDVRDTHTALVRETNVCERVRERRRAVRRVQEREGKWPANLCMKWQRDATVGSEREGEGKGGKGRERERRPP